MACGNDDVQVRQYHLATAGSMHTGSERQERATVASAWPFFHRALHGLWACVNAACAGRRQTPLEDPDLGFWQDLSGATAALRRL